MLSSNNDTGFLSYHWPTLLIVVLGLVISVGAWQGLHYYEQRHLKDQFSNRTIIWVDSVQTKLNDAVNTLRSVRNLFHANRRVTALEFDRFTEPDLKRQKQILTIEWLPKLSADEIQEFAKNSDQPDDKRPEIWREDDDAFETVEEPTLGSYYPIMFVEQTGSDYYSLIGFSHASIKERRRAMERARDRGRSTMTDVHPLVHYGESNRSADNSMASDSRQRMGYYVFVPLFEQPDPAVEQLGSSDRRHLGFVVGGFSIRDQFKQFYGAQEQRTFNFALFEQHEDNQLKRIFTTSDWNNSSETSDLSINQTIDLPGQTWVIKMTPTERFLDENSSNSPLMALFLGLLTTGISTIFTYRFTRRARETELELTRSERLSRTMIDEVEKYSICILDTDGTVKTWNEGAKEIEGYEPEEVLGHNLSLFMPDKDDEHVDPEELLREAREKGRSESEGWRKRKSGDHYWANVVISALRNDDGQLIGFVRIARDLTERMSREQELKEAKETAEEANRAKSDFLAKMSHELRTPLTSIIGYSEMLQEDAEQEDVDDLFEEDLARIESSGRHLLNLINEILDLSKIEAGKMDINPETFPVDDLIREVISTTQPIADENDNDLVDDVDPEVGALHSDRTKVRQCLVNLLSNACKFTEDGTVTIRAFPDELNNDEAVTFEVEDTGIGISEDERDALFEAFEQIEETSTREFEGTGLGLTITKRFTDMVEGQIEVESEKGEGTLFRLTFPQMDTMSRTETDDETQEFDGDGPLVLIVDDNEQVRNIIRRTLDQQGFSTLMASTGEEGVELAREHQPDVITLDVIMPSKDGWTVINELKSHEQTADIPVIMVTIMEDQELGFSLGAEDFIVKPVDRSRLLESVSSLASPSSDGSILVVEDNEDDRKMLERLLTEEGFDVTLASNGREGLDRFEDQDPQAVFLDLMMPKMDGFEFLEKLRNEIRSDVPVIVVTAKSLTPSEEEKLNDRVQATIDKGAIDRDELLAELRRRVGNFIG